MKTLLNLLGVSRATGVVVASLLVGNARTEALEIQFDYSTDRSGFFAEGKESRRILESAAAYYELLLRDDLGALTPSGNNRLTVDYLDPVTRMMVEVVPPPIPANTILVYVGAGNLAGSAIGSAWLGGITPTGTLAWLDYVDTRGQNGIVYGEGANEVAPWGGSLAVDTLDAAGAPRDWDYSLGVRPENPSLHLYSLLLHELAHILGFGTCDAWGEQVDATGRFTGRQSVAAHGGLVPLDPTKGHWAEGTRSTVYGTTEAQESAMDPILIADAPSFVTALDMAGLADIGWQVGRAVPPPRVPLLFTEMDRENGSLVVGWQGSPQYQYTLLVTKDFLRWRAVGPTLPGIAAAMRASRPANDPSLGYRVLVENRPTPSPGMLLAPEIELEAPDERGDGEVMTRRRPGRGAMQQLRKGPGAGFGAHRCLGCAEGTSSSGPVWQRVKKVPTE